MSALDSKDHRGKTVLVVDDSKMIRVIAEKLLLEAGYEVILATDGFEALSKIVEHPPELIIMDILMPEMDGYQTCTLIKNHRSYENIPIIMLSGKDTALDRSRGKMAGFDLCLAKEPFPEIFKKQIIF